MTVENWQDGAAAVLTEITNRTSVMRPSYGWLDIVEDCIPTLDELAEGDIPALSALFRFIGASTLINNEQLTYHQILGTLCGKQRDYGHGNINKHGLHGIIVRLSDKVERFKNLTAIGGTAINETIDDTALDIIGYAVIALMLIDGTFQLPLTTGVAA